jgi:hypothetical protein
VRIHTGRDAEASAGAIGARAYASGSDVVFGAGQFAPTTPSGRRLLAHELTHTIQQTGGGPPGSGGLVAGEAFETPSTALSLATAAPPAVQRQTPPGTVAAPAGKEITLAQLQGALTAANVEARLSAIITLFQVGDYITLPTLLVLANLPATPPAGESGDRAGIRTLLSAVNRIERTSGGFVVRLTIPGSEVVAKVKGLNLKIKDGAVANVSTTNTGDLAVDLAGVKVQTIAFVGLPSVTLSDNTLNVLGIPIPLVKEK